MNYLNLLWILALPALLVAQLYLLGLKMSEPEKMIHPIPGGLGAVQKETILLYKDWLASVNLELRTTFQFGTIQVAVFQHGDLPRFLSIMFHQRVTFAAESYLEDLTILDTSNSGSIGLFPRPGAYAQSFPRMSPAEMWQLHLEGEAHLTRQFGFQWVPLKRSYQELVIPAMRLRMQYNRSQSFWPVRVLYRYFVSRRLLANRSIVQQFP